MDKATWLTLTDIFLPAVTAIVVLLVGLAVGRSNRRAEEAMEANRIEHDKLYEMIRENRSSMQKWKDMHEARAARIDDVVELKGRIERLFSLIESLATKEGMSDVRSRLGNLEAQMIQLAQSAVLRAGARER